MPIVWVLTAGMAALGACGEPGQHAPSGPSADRSSHPFAVDKVDSHYELSVAGRGTDNQQWDYEMGSDQAYVVVGVDRRVVVASVVPWEPMESSLKWASASGDRDPEEFVLDDGRSAAYGEGTDGGWDDLVIELGPTEALRIATEDGTRDDLVGFARYLRSDGDAAAAPTVKDPPPAWKVIGSVGADALVAMRAQVYPNSNAVPGPTSGYSIGWLDTRLPVDNSSLSSLAVMVLPGDSADLEALAVRAPRYGESNAPAHLKVDGRAALLFDGSAQFGSGQRVIVTNDGTGALVVVAAYGEGLPTEQELVTLAGSVQPIDKAEWERFEVEAFGGPGLNPDRGETELARGDADGVAWLMQTSTTELPPGATGPDLDGNVVPLGPRSVRVDECLKLSSRQRSCPQPSGGGRDGSVYLWTSSGSDFDKLGLPEYVMITTSQPAATQMRVTVGSKVVEADVHPVPDGGFDTVGAGIAFVELPKATTFPICNPNPPPVPEGMAVVRVDLLDGLGNAIGCVGM